MNKLTYLFVFYIIETRSMDVSGVFVKCKTLVSFILNCLELSKYSGKLDNAVKSPRALRTFTRHSSERGQGIVSFP